MENRANNIIIRRIITCCLVWLVFFLNGWTATAPKYFILEETNGKCRYTQYTLKTKQLYPCDKEIIIFNLFPAAVRADIQDLVVFSVLPHLEGETDWEEISPDSLSGRLLSVTSLMRLKERSLAQRFNEHYPPQTKFFNEIVLVIRRGEKYVKAPNTLLQFFAIRDRPYPFPDFYGMINISQDTISIKRFREVFREHFPHSVFPLDSWRPSYYADFDYIRERREFLSRHYTYQAESHYQFWTYIDWHVRDVQYEVERGVDRFVYVPGKGIVGGGYDFYFYYHRHQIGLDLGQFGANILEEKVMLAEELK